MEIQKLHYFLTVCKCGSYSAAAKQLLTSRQAVSKAIHQLESELGTTFFVLQNNRLRLTNDGEYMRSAVTPVISEINELERHFSKRIPKNTNKLHVAFSHDSFSLFPSLDWGRLKMMDLVLTEHSITRCLNDLKNGKVDLCILAGLSKEYPPFVCKTLFRSPLDFIVSKEVAATLNVGEAGLRIADLDGFAILLLSDKENVYADFLEKYRKLNIGEEKLHTVTDQSLMRKLVRSGNAIGLAPHSYTSNLPNDLIGVPSSNKHLAWNVVAVCLKESAGDRRIDNFLAILNNG